MRSPTWHLRGKILPDDVVRDVYVRDGRISFAPPADRPQTLLRDGVIVPGLVDVHAHLALHSPAGDAAPAAERVRASAQAHLDAGVLAIREPGSPGYESAELGPAIGLPRVVTAGRFLAPPGDYFPGLAREVSRDELPDAALEELAHGGRWVKLIGDTPLPPGLRPTYDAEAVSETVQRVHDAGGKVAVHCSLPEVIQSAIDAGVDSLEHAILMRHDQLAAVATKGIAWVPTRSINDSIRGMISVDPRANDVIRGLDAQDDVLCAAVDSGVTLLAGTDAGMGPHGMVRREIELIAAAGVDPTTALAGGSWIARRWLGLPLIEEGAPADLVAFHVDPRADLAVLAEPAVVILDGRVVRS